jgi:transposase-like protein
MLRLTERLFAREVTMDDSIPKKRNKRRRYSEKFKRQSVALLAESGKPAGEVATSLGIDRSNLQKWKKQFSPDIELRSPGFPADSFGSHELRFMQEEIFSLKQMVNQLQAIMRKAFINLYQEDTEPSHSKK